jgi:hypothetical protein
LRAPISNSSTQTMARVPLALMLTLLVPVVATAQEFDWQMLNGLWAESTDHKFGCRPDNLHQQLVVSADRKTLSFKNDRNWKIGTGSEVKEYTAEITRFEDRSLFIKYGPELGDLPPEYREWEMRFVGPGTYRWRALSWPRGQFNTVIGVKCKP